jgi:hypothetical protein
MSDAFDLSVLSSRIHVTWTLAVGGLLEDRPIYTKTQCFDPFPFPDPPEEVKARLRDLGERLDSFRKERLAQHKQLTMTKMYNTLEKLHNGEEFSESDHDLYQAGLISVLREIHDEIDATVAQAYGWPKDLSDDEILERLVALNLERAAEERAGKVRWLRPDFQAPEEVQTKKAEQIEADLGITAPKQKKDKLPDRLPEQVAAIRAILESNTDPIALPALSRRFSQGRKIEHKVEDVLETLTLLGQVEQVDTGYILKG